MQFDLPEGEQLEINHKMFSKRKFYKPYLFRRKKNRPDPKELRDAVEQYGKQIQELRFQKEVKMALNEYLKEESEFSTDTVVKIKDAVKTSAEEILVATFKKRKRQTSSYVKIHPVTKIPRTIQLVTNNIMKIRTLSEVSNKDEGKKWIDQNITIKSKGLPLDRTITKKSKVCIKRDEKVKSKTSNACNNKNQTLNKCKACLSSDKDDLPSTSGHKNDKPDQDDDPGDSANVKAPNVIFHSIYSNVPLEGLSPNDPRIRVRFKYENLNKTSKTKFTNLDKHETNIYSKIPLWGLHPNDPRVEKRFAILDLMQMTSKEAMKHEIKADVEENKDHDSKLGTNISKHKHGKTQSSRFSLDDNSRSLLTKYNQVYLHVHKHIFSVADKNENDAADYSNKNSPSNLTGFAVSGNNYSKISSKTPSNFDNKSESSTANTTITDINCNVEKSITQRNQKDIVSETEDEISCSSSGIIDHEVQHRKPLIYDKSIGKRVRCGRGRNSKKWQAMRRRLIKKYSRKP